MIPILIKWSLTRPAIMTAKAWREIMKRAMGELGRFFHRRILPKHFTHAGATEYGYKDRQNALDSAKLSYRGENPMHYRGSGGDAEINYSRARDRRWSARTKDALGRQRTVWAAGVSATHTGRKLREKGHTYPLVFSGRLKRMVEGVQDVRPTSKGVSIVLHVPAYVKQRPHGTMSPDMATELTTISAADEQLAVRFLDRAIQRGINRVEQRRSAGRVA